MTPKEKAEELLDKFYPMFNNSVRDVLVKHCALIATDLLIETSGDIYDDTISYNAGYTGHLGMRSYWREVKKEIEKL